MESYIPLNEYAYRYKVSVQELRKKIQLKQIEFIFSDYEYLIKDKPFEQHYPMEKKLPLILNETEQIKKLNQKLEISLEKLEDIQQENLDLKNLCQFLETENKKLKEIVLGNQKINAWIKTHS